MFVLPELKKTQADLDAMKSQAQSTNREYDRLAEENQKLQVSTASIEVTYSRYLYN